MYVPYAVNVMKPHQLTVPTPDELCATLNLAGLLGHKPQVKGAQGSMRKVHKMATHSNISVKIVFYLPTSMFSGIYWSKKDILYVAKTLCILLMNVTNACVMSPNVMMVFLSDPAVKYGSSLPRPNFNSTKVVFFNLCTFVNQLMVS